AYPYARLVDEGRARGRADREFEIEDTGVFARGHWDVTVEYAKASSDDILIRITITNRGDAARLHLLPTIWLGNTSGRGRLGAGDDAMGAAAAAGGGRVAIAQPTLGRFVLDCGGSPELLFTDNETNRERLWGVTSSSRFTKDAFHRRVIAGELDAVNPEH